MGSNHQAGFSTGHKRKIFSLFLLFQRSRQQHNWWQVFFCGAAVLGSYLASALHFGGLNVFDASIQGAKPLLAFVGGIFLLLGAKTMRACTSGHGLSGMALMSIASIVATMGIFGGGIITGVLVNRYL